MTSFQKKRNSFMDDICSPIAESTDFSTFLIIEELESLKGDELKKRLEEFDACELEKISEMYEELIEEKKEKIKKLKENLDNNASNIG